MDQLLIILAQIEIEGFDEVSQLGPLFGFLVAVIFILSAVIIVLYRNLQTKINKIDEIKDAHIETIKILHQKHIEKLENIRNEMIDKENARTSEIREFEKEMLNVINGVNTVLEMSEKMKVNDTNMLVNLLKEIKDEVRTKKN